MIRITGLTALAVIICIIYTSVPAKAQSKTDSFLRVLSAHAKEDTTTALLHIELAKHHFYSNADSQHYYASKALKLSEKLQYSNGIILSMEEMGSSNFLRGKYDSAIHFATQGLQLCYTTNDLKNRSPLHNNIANAKFRKGKYAEAMTNYDSSLHYATITDNTAMTGKALSNIANVYYTMGSYTKALEYYLKGLKIQEQSNNSVAIASDVSNIANVYMRLGDYKNAAKYNNRGLSINRKANARNYIIGNLTTAAMIFNEQQQYDAALASLNEALQIANAVGNEFLQTLLKGNMAEMYLKKGEYDKSLALYTEAKAASEKMQDDEGIAIANAGIGEIRYRKGEHQAGLAGMVNALQTIQQLGIKEQARDIAGKLAGFYEQLNDYKNAYHYYKINHAYRDSLQKTKTHDEAQQLLFNYEIEKKETEIALLEKDKALAAARNNTQNLLLLGALGAIILSAIIAFMFFRNASRERKRQRELQKQKEEIECQANKLKELNDIKDVTFSVLSHDLRSPVNALTGTMMMLDEKLMTPEEFSMHKDELNNKLQSVSLLLENMLYWAQSRMKGEHALDIEKLNIKRKALKTMAMLKDAAAQKNINLTHNVAEDLYAYGDANQVNIILRNLVSNAIKFTPDGGSVSINGFASGNTTQISVTDTGVGMTDEQLSKLFRGLSIESTKGTGGEKGTGLGLQLCYEFIQQNGGEIVVTSTPGKGSTFTITLPNTI